MSDTRANLELLLQYRKSSRQGIADLGLPEEDVDVEVLDSGSKACSDWVIARRGAPDDQRRRGESAHPLG